MSTRRLALSKSLSARRSGGGAQPFGAVNGSPLLVSVGLGRSVTSLADIETAIPVGRSLDARRTASSPESPTLSDPEDGLLR